MFTLLLVVFLIIVMGEAVNCYGDSPKCEICGGTGIIHPDLVDNEVLICYSCKNQYNPYL